MHGDLRLMVVDKACETRHMPQWTHARVLCSNLHCQVSQFPPFRLTTTPSLLCDTRVEYPFSRLYQAPVYALILFDRAHPAQLDFHAANFNQLYTFLNLSDRFTFRSSLHHQPISVLFDPLQDVRSYLRSYRPYHNSGQMAPTGKLASC